MKKEKKIFMKNTVLRIVPHAHQVKNAELPKNEDFA